MRYEHVRTHALAVEDGTGIRRPDGFGIVVAATSAHLHAVGTHPTDALRSRLDRSDRDGEMTITSIVATSL